MLGEGRRGERFFEICRSWSDMGVYPDDRELFRKSMERETLLEVLDRSGAFIMTYRIIRNAEPTYITMKVTRMDDDERFIIIGITNMDEEMKQRKANERMREQHIAYSRINDLKRINDTAGHKAGDKYIKDACVAQVFERADLNMYENKSELKSRKNQ